MSSSMLEQAVIDAQALKEAAIKNAEQEVLGKYAEEIKEAVDTLLEQPIEDPMAVPMADPMVGDAEADKITDKLSLKALEGVHPGEEDKVELDLDELEVAMGTPEEVEEQTNVMLEASKEDLENLLSEDEPAEPAESAELIEEDDDEVELDEESLKNAIEEMLKVDIENVPRGNIGTTHPTKTEQIHAVEVAAAADEDTNNIEESEEFEKAVKKITNLEEQIRTLKSGKNRLVKDHDELKSIAREVSEKLTDLNITNAKLVYQNRVLKSISLNERQKDKLVEAISKANSIEEAKVIYETLQNSLTVSEDKSPKNLREAISKNSRLVLKSNRKETQVSDSATERMKKLAGII